MGTISYLFGLLCIIALLGHRGADRDLLGDKINDKQMTNNQITNKQITNKQITNKQITNDQKSNYQISKSPDLQISNKQINQINKSPDHQINHLLNIAKSQIGVREATGNNDGVEVEQYLAYTGNKKGEAWCASFVSWVFGKAGYTAPRTAWSPSLFPNGKLMKAGAPGTVFGIYFNDKKRIAHAGLVERKQGSWIFTIEGNTNVAGSREGDGVYRRLRHAKTIAAYANWLPIKKGAKP